MRWEIYFRSAKSIVALSVSTVLVGPVVPSNGSPVEQEGYITPSESGVEATQEEFEITIGETNIQWLKFQKLTKEWRDTRGARSTAAQMAMLRPYQEIIGMGEDAIPFILAQLKAEGSSPDHWFWALAAISNDNPVPAKSRGKLSEMAVAWLEWGRQKEYV